jgi:hypothetical protein
MNNSPATLGNKRGEMASAFLMNLFDSPQTLFGKERRDTG